MSKDKKPMTQRDVELEFRPIPGVPANPDTGEVAAPEPKPQTAPVVDVVHMPKKIVAKDIVGRAGLKCSKKWTPVMDKDGKQALDKEGNPLGEWVLSPPRSLYRVFGTATGTRGGTSVYGDWIAFTGTFEAVRVEDGARFRSNELILQQPAEGLLLNALGGVKRNDEGGGVNFAFDIGVKTSQRWVDTGEGNSYEYTITSVFNVQQHDPLEHMRKSLPAMPVAQRLIGSGG